MKKRNGKFVRVAENLYRYSSNKKYYGVFRHDEKVIWRNLETADRELANRKLRELLQNSERIAPKKGKRTLVELLAMFEENLKMWDAGTQENKRAVIKQFRASWPGGLDAPVSEATEAQVESWLAAQRGRMSKTGLNAYIIFMHQLFDLALRDRVIAVSPAANVKTQRPERPIRLTPTWDQFETLVKEIRAQRFSAEAQDSGDLIEFMGLAGVGMAECVNLQGEHIDFEGNKILLYRHKTDSAYSIPIFPQLKPLLARLKKSGAIQSGKPVFDVKDPKKGLTAACKRLKFPQFTSRSLRRCFITRAIEKGIDFKTIAAWQGHRDGGVLIARTYSHLRNEHSDAMSLRLQLGQN